MVPTGRNSPAPASDRSVWVDVRVPYCLCSADISTRALATIAFMGQLFGAPNQNR